MNGLLNYTPEQLNRLGLLAQQDLTTGTINPSNPNMVDKAQGLLAQGFMKMGYNPRDAYAQANKWISTQGDMGAADFVPLAGDLIGAQDAYDMGGEAKNAFNREEYLKALGYGAGSAATGVLSGIGALATVAPPLDKGIDAARVGVKKATGLLDNGSLRRWVEGHNGGPLLNEKSAIDSVDLPAGSKVEYTGAAPDRSEGSYPRYIPKVTPVRMQRLLDAADDPNSNLLSIFDEKIKKGMDLKGQDWYNTEELRDWFTEILGQDQGHNEWKDFIEKVGANSTGSKVPENIRIASFYRALGDDAPRVSQYVIDNGGTPREAMKAVGIEIPNMPPETGKGSYNYGHLKQRSHAINISNQYKGTWEATPPPELKGAALTKWLQANPKVKGFKNDLLGNTDNIAADMHFMRLLGMSDGSPDFLTGQANLSKDNMDKVRSFYGNKLDKYQVTRKVNNKPVTSLNLKKAVKDGVIKDTDAFTGMPSAWAEVPDATEYAAYERLATAAAKKYGLTPAQFQAALWMGAGDLTNLADESQGTFMELFRRSLDKRGGERGLTRKEMLEDFLKNKAPLSIAPIAGAGLLGATAMSQQENQQQPTGILQY